VLLPPAVSGQRAVASLGKRLQKRFGGGRTKQNGRPGSNNIAGDEETYILEGEKYDFFQYYYQRWILSVSALLLLVSSSASSSPLLAATVTTIAAILVGLLLRLLHKHTTEITEDGE
jgi:hypothetical protein